MKSKKVYKCSVCHKPGHNRLDCPELVAEATNGHLPQKIEPGSMTARDVVTRLRLKQAFIGEVIQEIEKLA